MKVEQITLPNKLRVILADTGGAESATVLLLVKAGSRYEDPKNNGIAHFFEHMAFKGSAKYADSFTISSRIEGMVCFLQDEPKESVHTFTRNSLQSIF